MLVTAAVLAALALPQADTTFPVERSQRLDASAHAGSIAVRAWDRNAVRVRAELGGRARLAVDRSPGTVRVRAAGDHGEPAATLADTGSNLIWVEGETSCTRLKDLYAEKLWSLATPPRARCHSSPAAG